MVGAFGDAAVPFTAIATCIGSHTRREGNALVEVVGVGELGKLRMVFRLIDYRYGV